MKRLLIALLSLTLVGCSSSYGRPKLPYDAWYIGIGAPRHMEVWVESVDVIDQRGLAFERVHGGVVAYNNKTLGWWNGGGSMKPIGNVDLPEIIFVRWQSLVEPQTYNVRIDIPQWVRDEMVKPQRAFCPWSQKWKTDYRQNISIGMAPGGIAKAWIGGPCLENKEIGRFVGKVDKRGPDQGQSGGRYAWPSLEPESKAYIEQHGIPYGSW
ncbi:DUF2931 family protein [Metapseudomonas lalkuanensis]|uniref:DUF2931 family protein n=1 Tax=Metapseudomonas lalkuanensis TaxID=2604832 RepID=UPI001CF277CE|nr:DUF2931 family protein [Pseudomonas lalkuanensis]UCP00459.1 DUF2931 family protein [Pseudomonas lalkuanensis]